MKILITNWVISNNSGTELYVKELAIELKKRGHDIEIFTGFVGKLADELIHHQINVVTHLSSLKNTPDIIHAHHNLLTPKVVSYFNNTPIVSFIHDRTSSLDYPYIHKNIIRYVAVDHNCRERYLVEGKFKEEDIDVIFNWYNPERFVVKDKINLIPKNALIFSNYINKGKIYSEIQAACKSLNIDLDIIGNKSGNPQNVPEIILNNYDIVFGKAKAGIEALSTANALIVCDFRGLGGMVTPENVEQYRNFNFGMKLMTKPIQKDLIVNEINKYNSTDIQFVTQYIRSASNFFDTVTVIENMYSDAILEFKDKKSGIKKEYFLNHLYIILINSRHIFLLYLSKNIALYNLVKKAYQYFKK